MSTDQPQSASRSGGRITPTGADRQRLRVAVLDFDGTLVRGDLLTLLAGLNGKAAESEALNGAFHTGRLLGVAALVARMNLLTGITLRQIREALAQDDHLMAGARELFAHLHAEGVVTIVASGRMLPVLEYYQQLLGIDHLIGTHPAVRDGVIEGMSEADAPAPDFKLSGVLPILTGLGLSFGEAIAVGDSPADRQLLKRAGLSVAINPVGGIEADAHHVIHNDLRLVIDLMNRHQDGAVSPPPRAHRTPSNHDLHRGH